MKLSLSKQAKHIIVSERQLDRRIDVWTVASWPWEVVECGVQKLTEGDSIHTAMEKSSMLGETSQLCAYFGVTYTL